MIDVNFSAVRLNIIINKQVFGKKNLIFGRERSAMLGNAEIFLDFFRRFL
jgi:hypothetical protein